MVGLAQGARELRREGSPLRPSCLKEADHDSQVIVAPCRHELGLDLPPAGSFPGVLFAGAESLRTYKVLSEFDQHLAGRVADIAHVALRRDLGNRAEGLVPAVDEHEVGQRPGHGLLRTAEGRVDLLPLLAVLNLEVPARVLAARTPPQRDAGAGEPQVGGVVVGRLQKHDTAVRHAPSGGPARHLR